MSDGQPPRRRFLKTVSVFAATGFAGCLTRAGSDSPTESKGKTPTPARATTNRPNDVDTQTRVSNNSTESPTEGIDAAPECPDKLFRCQGEPVSVERSFTDPSGYQVGEDDQPDVADGIEYDPSDGTVQIATRVSNGEVVETRTISFEEWARMEATSIGRSAVVEQAEHRSEIEIGGSSIGHPPEWADVEPLCLKLKVSLPDDPDQTKAAMERTISRLAEAAPRAAIVTISLEGDTASQSIPVFTECMVSGKLRLS